MNCAKFNYDISKEYMHIPNKIFGCNIESSGMFFANGESKIVETKKTKNNQKGGSRVKYSINRSPAYYQDFTKTIGGRPEIIRNDNEQNLHILSFNKNEVLTKYNYGCKQPTWLNNCR